MRKDMLALVAAIGVLSCAEAPTDAGTSRERRLVHSTPSLAVTAAGQVLQVAMPDIGPGLVPDEQLVATGRTGSVDINDCDGFPVTAARYGALTGAGRADGHSKMHFSTDVGAGTRMSNFSYRTTCSNLGTIYFVYDVETQEPAFAETAAGQVLYVVIPDIGAATPFDEQLVATGRTGSVDIEECDGFPVTAARYAAFTGAGRQGGLSKMHFLTDVGPGTRMSEFTHSTTCTIGGTQYQVYFVETQ